jgi:hypothetical protein
MYNGTGGMYIFSTGNIAINSTVDAGFRLDVSGTIRSTTFISAGTGSTGGYYVGATSGSGAFMIRGYADTTNPGIEKVAANNSPFEFYQRGQSSNAYTFRFSMTDSNARLMSVGSGAVDNIRVLLGFGVPNANNISGNVLALRPVYNQTGSTNTGTILTGIYYEPTLTDLTGATHRAIHTVTGDVLFATTSGNVGIGTTSPTTKLQVNGTISTNAYSTAPTSGFGLYMGHDGTEAGIFSYNYTTSAWLAISYSGLQHRWSTSGSERMRIFSNGNIAINSTTDAGFRLDVNGTARIINTTFGNNGIQILTNLSNTGGISLNGSSVASNAMYVSQQFTLQQTNSYTATSGNAINITSAVMQSTSGTVGGFGFSVQFGATSGTATFNGINLNPNINLTGTYSGIVRGIFYNPTLTSLTGVTHRAIETVTGDVLFGTTSGSVGIGANTSIAASAILDITSTTKGFLPPRMTTTQRNAITSPAEGLIVYDTTSQKLYVYTTGWEEITSTLP